MTIRSYKDLVVWQKAIELVVNIYDATTSYPPHELYGLVAQMRRAAVSIPSNIAEGHARGTRRDYRYFLIRALASGAELETQILISKRLAFGQEVNFGTIDVLLVEIMKMLNTLTKRLDEKPREDQRT